MSDLTADLADVRAAPDERMPLHRAHRADLDARGFDEAHLLAALAQAQGGAP